MLLLRLELGTYRSRGGRSTTGLQTPYHYKRNELKWWLYVAVNDISIIYVTASWHINVQAVWRRLTYGGAPNAIFISYGSLIKAGPLW